MKRERGLKRSTSNFPRGKEINHFRENKVEKRRWKSFVTLRKGLTAKKQRRNITTMRDCAVLCNYEDVLYFSNSYCSSNDTHHGRRKVRLPKYVIVNFYSISKMSSQKTQKAGGERTTILIQRSYLGVPLGNVNYRFHDLPSGIG